jgi:opacity protein-like surface antigen
MRSALAVVLVLGLPPAAQAADLFDLPILRGSSGPELGPPGYSRWDGFYAGAQAGYQAAKMNFGNSSGEMIAHILRNTTLENEARVSDWTVLPSTTTSGTSWGGFVGYNMQWESAVIGLELNYDRSGLSGSASDALGRTVGTSAGPYSVQLSSTSSLRINDVGTARLRGGWSAGWFMPYMFAALAVARVDVESTVTVNALEVNTGNRLNQTQRQVENGAFAYGYAFGVGVDVALMSNLFVRAEWEYLKITHDGGSDADVNTIRGGVGVKF